MKKTTLLIIISVLCCCTIFFGSLSPAQAAMSASVVTAKVTLNGQVIDNTSAKYPLLLYSNITYIPMTYHLSRFMGLSTDWNDQTRTLNINAGGGKNAYIPETGKRQTGRVFVTLPTYKTYVNGVYINNKNETYPIFNYNGVTYFPLTWAYAVDSFGWGYQWDARNGLRIDTATAFAPAPTEPNTGNDSLDAVLTALNSNYAAGGNYHGTLTGPKGQENFTAKIRTDQTTSVRQVEFSATPFPFFENGLSYFANYYPANGDLASEEQIGFSGNAGGLGNPLEVDETSEKVYVGKCFLDCQFTGNRSKRIADAKKTTVVGDVATWSLKVKFADGGFTGYTADVSVDAKKGTVSKIILRTANYTLTMVPY